MSSNEHNDDSYDSLALNKRLMGNITRLPVLVNLGQGSSVTDQSSGAPHELLDFWGDEGVASLGYGEAFNKHLQDFIASGTPHRIPDVYPSDVRYACAEIICKRTKFDRLFFANSGTEANEAAIKLARKYWWDNEPGRRQPLGTPTRNHIYTLAGNFHGRTGYAMASSDFRVSPYHREGFGPSSRGFGVIDLIDGKFMVVAFEGREVPPHHVPWDETAAVIMAPVLGNNCVKTYSREFWQTLEDEVRTKNGALIIYDDVQAGNGRAGNFATYQNPICGVKPDIMTLSKGIAMGLPMSVMLADEHIAKSFTPGVHFNTFGGTLLCCYLATRLYEWLDKNLDEVRAKGEEIREAFAGRSWIDQHDGWGMLNAFRPNFEANGYDAFQFIAKTRELGLSLCTHRKMGMIRFTPPLNVSRDDIQRALAILDAAHKELYENVARVATPSEG